LFQIEKRIVIKYLFIKRMSTKEIYDDMFVTLGDDGPLYSAVKNLVAEFKRSRSSVVDEHRSGRPKMQQVLKTFRLSMTC